MHTFTAALEGFVVEVDVSESSAQLERLVKDLQDDVEVRASAPPPPCHWSLRPAPTCACGRRREPAMGDGLGRVATEVALSAARGGWRGGRGGSGVGLAVLPRRETR